MSVQKINWQAGQSRSDRHLYGEQLCKSGSEAVLWIDYGVDDSVIK